MKEDKAHPLGVPGGGTWPSNDDASSASRSPTVTGLDRWLARTMLSLNGNPRIALVLWDGEEILGGGGPPVARARVHDRRTLVQMMRSPSVGFGDAYSTGLVEVPEHLVELLEEVYRGLMHAGAKWSRLQRLRASRTRGNTPSEARENIHHHYDLGNDFYRLWLDERMVYTCAYYEHPGQSLAEAQIAKMDHVCRKLELQSGQRVIEAGCGWGALAMHMAERYGATVEAYNISRQQIEFARAQAHARGLENRVRFIEDDYRSIEGECDAFVSVGMLEHVGTERYGELGAVVERCLRPDGRGLIHSIGRSAPAPNDPWIEKRIFPGSYPPTLTEMGRIFEPYEFSILDVENLRLHYRETCRAWLDRFDAVADKVAEMYDMNFVRAWRLYLAGSTAAFAVGTLQLYQVVFAPRGTNRVPWTRHHLYQDSPRLD